MLQFGLRFGLLMALYYALALQPWVDRIIYPYLKANAWLSHVMLNFLGQECAVSEVTIRSAGFAISVRRGCDALEPSWFLCAAILSFSARPARKFLGILIGSAVLNLLNLLRIVSLYLVGLRFPRSFEVVHLEIWPVAFIVTAILLWIRWIRWAQPDHDCAT